MLQNKTNRYKSISDFAELLLMRVETKQDAVIIVDSLNRKGIGKSSFSGVLAEEICKQKGFKFDVLKIFVFDASTEKVTELIKSMPEGYPVIIDEALKVAFNRNWNEKDQKNLVIFLNVCRKWGKIIIINNPSFDKLDKAIRDISDYRVTVLKRGYAVIRRKMSREMGDPWILKETDEKLMESEEYESEGESKDNTANVLRHAKNFYFETSFPAMNPTSYHIYEEASKEQEMNSFMEAQSDHKRFVIEGLCGVINTLKDIHESNGFIITWQDVAVTINQYLAKRHCSYTTSTDLLSKTARTLVDQDFDSSCNKVLRKRTEYLKLKNSKDVITTLEAHHDGEAV